MELPDGKRVTKQGQNILKGKTLRIISVSFQSWHLSWQWDGGWGRGLVVGGWGRGLVGRGARKGTRKDPSVLREADNKWGQTQDTAEQEVRNKSVPLQRVVFLLDCDLCFNERCHMSETLSPGWSCNVLESVQGSRIFSREIRGPTDPKTRRVASIIYGNICFAEVLKSWKLGTEI